MEYKYKYLCEWPAKRFVKSGSYLWIMNTLLEFSWQQKIITQWLIFICPGHWAAIPGGISGPELSWVESKKEATTSDNVLNINIFFDQLLLASSSKWYLIQIYALHGIVTGRNQHKHKHRAACPAKIMIFAGLQGAQSVCLCLISYRTIK